MTSGSPTSIGLTADRVLWSHRGGNVWAMPKEGGDPAALTNHAGDGTNHGNLLLDATHGYLGNWLDDGALTRFPLDGSDPQATILVEAPFPLARALHGGRLYYTLAQLPTLWSIPAGGGEPAVAAELSAALRGCAQEGALIYCNLQGGEIVEVDMLSGAARTVLAASAVVPSWLALDTTHVYFVDEPAGAVARVPRVGGAVETVATGQDEPSALAVDGAFVYWVAEVVSNPKLPYFIHTILRAPKGGGETEVFVSNHCPPDLCEIVLFRPTGLVFDDTHAYWASHESEGSSAVIARAKK